MPCKCIPIYFLCMYIMLMDSFDKQTKDGKKPDFMIGTKLKKKDLYFFFFFIEAKRPDTTSKYQPEDGYTKLLKQMKGSVDDQLCLGVKKSFIAWSFSRRYVLILYVMYQKRTCCLIQIL